jgi:hypothetical protein
MEFKDMEKGDVLQLLRTLPDDVIEEYYLKLIPEEAAPSDSFWASYDSTKRSIGLRCCLLALVALSFSIIPREFQLQAAISTLGEQDCLVDVGTGYGKTLCMILPALYQPDRILVVVSPLKRLQTSQVAVFQKYGISAVAINEDTPNDSDLWKVTPREYMRAFSVAITLCFVENLIRLLLCACCAARTVGRPIQRTSTAARSVTG